jgi:hypothetical protein
MTLRDDDDGILERLRELPQPELDRLHAERVRRTAQAVLARERRLVERPVARRLERLWSGVVEPALVAGTVGVYLVWAIRAAEALYR